MYDPFRKILSFIIWSAVGTQVGTSLKIQTHRPTFGSVGLTYIFEFKSVISVNIHHKLEIDYNPSEVQTMVIFFPVETRYQGYG